MSGDHFAGVAVHIQHVAVLKEAASISNADRGRYPAFSSKRGGVLKNRAFLDDESSDSREQGRKMWMKDAHNENRTRWNGHNIFGVPYHIRLPAGTSWRGAQARIDFR
jgi:hypothetical protein